MPLRSLGTMDVQGPGHQGLPEAEQTDPLEILHLARAHRAELLVLAARHRAVGVATVAGAPWLLVTFAPGASVSDHMALDTGVAALVGATGTVVAAGSQAARAIDDVRVTPL